MKNISSGRIKKKLLVVLLLITFIFCALVVRLFVLQVANSEELQQKALSQWARSLPLKADRGVITDVNGIVLAANKTLYNLYVRPNSLGDKDKTASAIAESLKIDKNEIYEKVSKKGVSEVTVVKNIDKNQMLAISAQKLQGVYFSSVSARVYPYGDFLTQVLGFCDSDNKGQTGIEAFYNNYLCGTDGKVLTETDLVGKELEGNAKSYVSAVEGMNVQLTIDYHIQTFANRAVNQAMLKYSAKGATCLVMNPTSGAIYAMAQSPSFDLNAIPRDDIAALFDASKNKLVSNVYEPGSTFKILTSAIGLEEGLVSENERFYCSGYRIIDGTRIKCWKSLGHGSQTFVEGVANSCNCVFMDIATRAGTAKMYQYFDKFGLTKKTGIDVSGEATGLLLKQEIVKSVDIARIGFGQAIAVTPIRLAAAAASVINGGKSVQPYLLESVQNGKAYTHKQTVEQSVISSDTSAKMRQYLENVVKNGGGKNAYIDGYSIGGKTGTAQKYENGAIAQGKYISSFLGFCGITDPDYLCLFIVDEPQGYEYYGSLVAAPLVREIYSSIIAYKGIKATQTTEEVQNFVMPDLTTMSITEAFATLKKLGMNYEYDGTNGNIIYQIPAAGSIVSNRNIAFLKLSE